MNGQRPLDGVLDVWGGGQLLAFSALDGQTDYGRGPVVRTAYDCAGLDVRLPGECHLRFGPTAPSKALLGGDFFELHVGSQTVRGAMLDAYHLLIEGPCEVAGRSESVAAARNDRRTLIAPAKMLDLTRIGADLDASARSSRRWMESRLLSVVLSNDRRRLLAKCLSVMKTQVYSPEGRMKRRWTTPDRWPHRRMFLWDSVFHAVGWRHADSGVARDAVQAMLDVQRPDGMVPHSNGPEDSSNITQPPVLAMGTMLVDELAPDDGWLREMYDGLCRYVEWDLAHRDTDAGGLLEWAVTDNVTCRCDESGMDNSPRFDAAVPLDAVDFNSFAAHECELLAAIADRLGKRQDKRRWSALHGRFCDLINRRLWNEELGFYVDCVAATGRQTGILAVSGFLPLLCGAASKSQARRLAEHLNDPETFGAPLPVPTLAACHKDFYSKDMWRGPAWVNYNWLIAGGLDRYGLGDAAAMIRRKTLDEVGRLYEKYGCLFEFYDDRRELDPPRLLRKGKCIPGQHPHMVLCDYGWTATCCADWMVRS